MHNFMPKVARFSFAAFNHTAAKKSEGGNSQAAGKEILDDGKFEKRIWPQKFCVHFQILSGGIKILF